MATQILSRTNSNGKAPTGADLMSAAFKSAFIPTSDNRIGVTRARIRFLRKTYGDILNRWPQAAQKEYHALARQLRQAENGVQR